MLNEFKEHIFSRFPFLREAKLLLACSGGVDSVVLSSLLHEAKVEFALAHCNFGLRGKESDKDQVFVQELSIKYGCEFFCKQFELDEAAGSIQLTARNLRYDWFHELLDKHGYDYILTAHHLDDSFETFFINLSRGTGIDGLTGIPEQNGKTIRPLLPFARKEILAYAQQEKLQWREDSSNVDTKYLRNKIRHDVVPVFKSLHPTALQNFQKTIYYLRDTQQWINNQIKNSKQKLFIKEFNSLKINIKELKKNAPIETTVYLLFREYGFTNIENLLELFEAESGKELRSESHRLVKNRDHLLLAGLSKPTSDSYEIHEQHSSIKNPIQLTIEEVNKMGGSSNNTIYVDKETLNYPLMIRKWKNGDYFYPFGMKGKKKISKFFKDEKIDILSKEQQWLICSGDNIVWIVGRRADERFKVTSKTTEILKFTVTA